MNLLGGYQWIAWLVLALGLAWAGWVVKARFDRAAEADRLERENRDLTTLFKLQIDATNEAERAKVKISGELAAARAASEGNVKEVVRVIRKVVVDRRECDVPVDVLSKLNANRGHALPLPAQ